MYGDIGSRSRLEFTDSVLRSTWLRVSKRSPSNSAGQCCCPTRSPTSSKAISISNASANITVRGFNDPIELFAYVDKAPINQRRARAAEHHGALRLEGVATDAFKQCVCRPGPRSASAQNTSRSGKSPPL